MTGPQGATFDVPPTVEAGGMVLPWVGPDGRDLIAIYSADHHLTDTYALEGGVYRLQSCDRCVPGEHGERLDVHTLDQQPCAHVNPGKTSNRSAGTEPGMTDAAGRYIRSERPSVAAFGGQHPRVEMREFPRVAGTLRLGRWCSEHGTDVLPPERTWATRRYCYRCPDGSALGPPERFPRGVPSSRPRPPRDGGVGPVTGRSDLPGGR